MLCLLFGFVVVVAMVSAVPMYSDAILQRMLDRDLTTYQSSRAVYAGLYTVQGNYSAFSREGNSKELAYEMHRTKVEDELVPELNTKIDACVHIMTAINMSTTPYAPNGEETRSGMSSSIASIRDLEDNVTLIAGRV